MATKKDQLSLVPGLSERAASRFQVFNSGLEVWIYDDANKDKIIASGAMDGLDDLKLATLFSSGMLAAYQLYQDDGLDIAVVVGDLLTDQELEAGRWLEPQTSFLALPSGKLCIESNDASRIGPEEPAEQGAYLQLEPGEYKLTLYRVDHEALDREGIKWGGPQEIVLLSPGGNSTNAAKEILPFQLKRDFAWVDKYQVCGKRADALIWFGDAWDTFTVNLNAKGVSKLGLHQGNCISLACKDPEIEIVSVYCESWKAGAALEPPSGVSLKEYGFCSLCPMSEWDGNEALFGKRHIMSAAIPVSKRKIWLPVELILLAAKALPPARIRGQVILDAGKRVYWQGSLAAKNYYRDLQLLTAKLMGKVEDLPWGEPIQVSEAVAKVDGALSQCGLTAVGDFTFDVVYPGQTKEFTNRIYLGLKDVFGAIWGSQDTFEVFFFSKLEDGRWLLTGTVFSLIANKMSERKGLLVKSGRGKLTEIFEQHRAHLAETGSAPIPLPDNLTAGVTVYESYLQAALD